MTTWAERVRQRASELKLSDADIARRVPCSRASFSNWMSGKRSPKPMHRYIIADILGVTAHWLETGEEAPEKIPGVDVGKFIQAMADLEAREQTTSENTGITILKKDSQGYLLRMTSDAMLNPHDGEHRNIPVGSTVRIDTTVAPQPGDIILIEYEGELRLRVWRPAEGQYHRLLVINPFYQNMLAIDYEGPLEKIYRGKAVSIFTTL
ncbi:S24 family peptidase [Endozoicomonas atrinae]|uniref:S24 family peptidase n=1 Tax=Endozoicomonas atrinae TaxID=1333660 RepID=UPI00111300A6|nr:S24 family peptidase [Endozoicomonas atrinae]